MEKKSLSVTTTGGKDGFTVVVKVGGIYKKYLETINKYEKVIKFVVDEETSNFGAFEIEKDLLTSTPIKLPTYTEYVNFMLCLNKLEDYLDNFDEEDYVSEFDSDVKDSEDDEDFEYEELFHSFTVKEKNQIKLVLNLLSQTFNASQLDYIKYELGNIIYKKDYEE